MKRADIVTEARAWLDVPWEHQGRSRLGVDCVGLVQKVGDKFGAKYVDLSGYSRMSNNVTFLRHLRKFTKPAPISGNKVGMIGVFRQVVYPCHVGIFSEKNGVIQIINSRADRRKVVEEPYEGSGFELIELLAYPGLED
jgi:hypothetical protein